MLRFLVSSISSAAASSIVFHLKTFVGFSAVMNGVVDHEEDFLFAIVSNSGLEGSGITIAMNDGSMFDPAIKLKLLRSL
ncbi:MAG: hypothetical protein EBT18_11500 [Gammaproteobacteria bacterium]|nr:hypothetical protein [Gammaproteobacteria bacterium]